TSFSTRPGDSGEARAREAERQTTGEAVYVDDIPEPAGTLHVAPGYAAIAAGRITSLDLEAVERAPGVVAVLTAASVPGANDISPGGIGDAPLFAGERIGCFGQPIFAVVART